MSDNKDWTYLTLEGRDKGTQFLIDAGLPALTTFALVKVIFDEEGERMRIPVCIFAVDAGKHNLDWDMMRAARLDIEDPLKANGQSYTWSDFRNETDVAKIVVAKGYWSCSCDERFIHHAERQHCPRCMSFKQEDTKRYTSLESVIARFIVKQ